MCVEVEKGSEIPTGFSGQLFYYSVSNIRTCMFLLSVIFSCYGQCPQKRSVPVMPTYRTDYQPLFIPCHELEWKMFGISSVLYESFYKRITLPIGDHV